MSGFAAVYRALDPAAIVALRDQCDAEHQAWFDQVKALITEVDPVTERRVMTHTGWSPSRRLAGYTHPNRNSPVPEGWRVDKQDCLVPRRTGAVGKAWAAKFDALVVAPKDIRDRLPGGMPSYAMYGLRVHSPAIDFGAEVYVQWAYDPELAGDPEDIEEGSTRGVRVKTIDPAVWERMKLSDYYKAMGQ